MGELAETTPLLRVQVLTGPRGFESLPVRQHFLGFPLLKIKTFLCLSFALLFVACGKEEKSEAQIMQDRINHGKSMYTRECIICHGAKAEKSYMSEVPPIKDLGSDARLEMMKQYKEGTLGKKGVYGLDELKKDVMIKLSEQDMQDIDLYIKEITGEK